MSVTIEPAPPSVLKFAEKVSAFRFMRRPPWIFGNSHHVWDENKKHMVPTRPPQEDIDLAIDLWRELDTVSRRWYIAAGWSVGAYWLPLTQSDFQACGATPAEIATFREWQEKHFTRLLQNDCSANTENQPR